MPRNPSFRHGLPETRIHGRNGAGASCVLDAGNPCRHVGFARVSFMGSETVTQIIFGPEDCDSILGTVALENTRIVVEPVSRTRKRMAAKPLK